MTAQSFTPGLVPRQQLLAANSALMISRATVGTTGAALGGILVSVVTAPIAIAADVASFLLAGLCKARIRTSGLAVVENRQPAHLRHEISEGLRIVFGLKVIRAVTLAATIGALAGQMQAVILVLYLVRQLGLSTALVGGAIAVGGAAGILGALAATPITRRAGPGPAFITGMFLASAGGLVLAAASRPLPLAGNPGGRTDPARHRAFALRRPPADPQTSPDSARRALARQCNLAVPRLRNAADRRAPRRAHRSSPGPAGHPDHQQRGDVRRHHGGVRVAGPGAAGTAGCHGSSGSAHLANRGLIKG